MRNAITRWTTGTLVAAAAAPLVGIHQAQAQGFKAPLGLSHYVYRPGQDASELEQLRAWSFGLGVIVGSRNQSGYGLVAHATYGGPYWYLAGSAGMWNSGSPAVDDFGFGVHAHYNVFQSRDFRTRVGWQVGWSTASGGDSRTHAIDYRAMVSHALTPSFALYGGLGGETLRLSMPGRSTHSTNPSALAGINTRLGRRFGLSSGVESVFSSPAQLRVSGSVQFELDYREEVRLESSGGGSGGALPK